MNIKSIIERVIALASEGESSPSRRDREQGIREILKTFSAAQIYMVTAVMY